MTCWLLLLTEDGIGKWAVLKQKETGNVFGAEVGGGKEMYTLDINLLN
jgi:hypothetical protein